jgi:hypothetical protein
MILDKPIVCIAITFFHSAGVLLKLLIMNFSSVRAPAQPLSLARDDFAYGYAKGTAVIGCEQAFVSLKK